MMNTIRNATWAKVGTALWMAVLMVFTMLSEPAMAATRTLNPDEIDAISIDETERLAEFRLRVGELTSLVAQLMDLSATDYLAKSEEEQTALKRKVKRLRQRCEEQGCFISDATFSRLGVAFNVELAAEILARYDALLNEGYSSERIASAVFKAGGMEYQLHETDYEPNDAKSACIDDCAKVFAVQAAAALVTYTSALAACTLTGPGWPFCVASATWAYAVAIDAANDKLQNCQDDCEDKYGEGGSATDTYCESDSDCASDEWCDKGVVLGIGVNECKPKKEEGKACSRDGVCLSDCCKFYWWRWECRPANKC